MELLLQVDRISDFGEGQIWVQLDDASRFEASLTQSGEHLRRDARVGDVRLPRELAGDDPEGWSRFREIGSEDARCNRECADQVDLGLNHTLYQRLGEGDEHLPLCPEHEAARSIDEHPEPLVSDVLAKVLNRVKGSTYLPHGGSRQLKGWFVLPQPLNEPEEQQIGVRPALHLDAGHGRNDQPCRGPVVERASRYAGKRGRTISRVRSSEMSWPLHGPRIVPPRTDTPIEGPAPLELNQAAVLRERSDLLRVAERSIRLVSDPNLAQIVSRRSLLIVSIASLGGYFVWSRLRGGV